MSSTNRKQGGQTHKGRFHSSSILTEGREGWAILFSTPIPIHYSIVLIARGPTASNIHSLALCAPKLLQDGLSPDSLLKAFSDEALANLKLRPSTGEEFQTLNALMESVSLAPGHS